MAVVSVENFDQIVNRILDYQSRLSRGEKLPAQDVCACLDTLARTINDPHLVSQVAHHGECADVLEKLTLSLQFTCNFISHLYEQVETSAKEMAQLKETIAQLKERLPPLEKSIAQLKEKGAQLEESISQRLHRLEENIAQLKGKITELEKDNQIMQRKLESHESDDIYLLIGQIVFDLECQIKHRIMDGIDDDYASTALHAIIKALTKTTREEHNESEFFRFNTRDDKQQAKRNWSKFKEIHKIPKKFMDMVQYYKESRNHIAHPPIPDLNELRQKVTETIPEEAKRSEVLQLILIFEQI